MNNTINFSEDFNYFLLFLKIINNYINFCLDNNYYSDENLYLSLFNISKNIYDILNNKSYEDFIYNNDINFKEFIKNFLNNMSYNIFTCNDKEDNLQDKNDIYKNLKNDIYILLLYNNNVYKEIFNKYFIYLNNKNLKNNLYLYNYKYIFNNNNSFIREILDNNIKINEKYKINKYQKKSNESIFSKFSKFSKFSIFSKKKGGNIVSILLLKSNININNLIFKGKSYNEIIKNISIYLYNKNNNINNKIIIFTIKYNKKNLNYNIKIKKNKIIISKLKNE